MLLVAEGLTKIFAKKIAVQGIHLRLDEGEVFGIVGESGCGKSTLARLLTGLETPDAGHLSYAGSDPRTWTRVERARFIQLMFQDSGAALHPRRRIGSALCEVLQAVRGFSQNDALSLVKSWLPRLDLSLDVLLCYPHQLSGGQKQRVCLLRALLLEPKVLVCDEPLTALDRMNQSRVLSLFQTLRRELGFALIYISHDLLTVKQVADRVGVMYAGQWMEAGPAKMLDRPQHPYTRLLLQSLPKLYRDPQKTVLKGFGEPLPPPKTGCPLVGRCPLAIAACSQALPLPTGDAYSACIRQDSEITDL